jgi:hypothetical protein
MSNQDLNRIVRATRFHCVRSAVRLYQEMEITFLRFLLRCSSFISSYDALRFRNLSFINAFFENNARKNREQPSPSAMQLALITTYDFEKAISASYF